jgi:hypothetical protein
MKKHYDEWAELTGVNEEEMFCLTAEEALVVAKMLFGSGLDMTDRIA